MGETRRGRRERERERARERENGRDKIERRADWAYVRHGGHVGGAD